MENCYTELPTIATTPMSANYIPELDTSPELGKQDVTFFQECIGMLQWIINIGRVDILTEVYILSSHKELPIQGHIEAVMLIFGYLKKNQN